MVQTYQQVFKIVKQDLINLDEEKLNQLNKTHLGFHEYFYELQQKNPKRYERLTFTKHPNYSNDLEDILRELRGNVILTKIYINPKYKDKKQ